MCQTKFLGRLEAQRAGSRQILVIHNIQESDYGSYMCYATNSIGSVQKIIEIKAEDKENKEFDFGHGKHVKSEKDHQRNYKILKKNLDKDRKSLIKLKLKMENEIQSIKNELSLKNSKRVGMEDSFEQAILADLGILGIQILKL